MASLRVAVVLRRDEVEALDLLKARTPLTRSSLLRQLARIGAEVVEADPARLLATPRGPARESA